MERKILKGIIEKALLFLIYKNSWKWEDKGLGEGTNEELMLNGYRVSVWDDGKVLEIDIGDGCRTIWMYLMSINCTLKNG